MKANLLSLSVLLHILFTASVFGQKYENGTRLLKGAEVLSATPLQLDYVLEKLADTAKITVNLHEGKTHLVLDDGSGKWREWWYYMDKWQVKENAGSNDFTESQWASINSGVTAADVAATGNHISDKKNPHAVNKTQVGLGNVDNTGDANKPVSTATKAALDKKANISDIPTSLPANGGTADNLKVVPEWHDVVKTYNSSQMITQYSSSVAVKADVIMGSDYPAKYGWAFVPDGWPTDGPFISFGENRYKMQIQADYTDGSSLYFRTRNAGGKTNNPWRKVATRLTEDAEWTEINVPDGYARYCRVKDMVMVYGTHSAQDIDNYTLPEGFRPKYTVYALCLFIEPNPHDSSNCIFVAIHPDGSFGNGITIARKFSYSVQFPVN